MRSEYNLAINLIVSDQFLGALGVGTSSTPIAGVCDRYRRNQSWSQRPRAQNAGYGEQPLGITRDVQNQVVAVIVESGNHQARGFSINFQCDHVFLYVFKHL